MVLWLCQVGTVIVVISVSLYMFVQYRGVLFTKRSTKDDDKISSQTSDKTDAEIQTEEALRKLSEETPNGDAQKHGKTLIV